jgi:hypothetical protein
VIEGFNAEAEVGGAEATVDRKATMHADLDDTTERTLRLLSHLQGSARFTNRRRAEK